jgi:uncharacterized protein YbjT (DUF2867 family)
MRDPQVVVFGGSGFIGSHLVALLSQESIPTLVPTRHADRVRHLTTLPGVDVVEANIHDGTALRSLLAGRTAAINLVGILHGSRAHPYGPEFRRAHVDLPRRIVDACAASGVPHYLHMSALGANPRGPSMYARSKADGEAAARSRRTAQHPVRAAAGGRHRRRQGAGELVRGDQPGVCRVPAGEIGGRDG